MAYLVPILGVVVAICGIFIDTGKEKSFRVLAPLLIIITLALGAFQIIDLSEAEADAENAEEQRKDAAKLLKNVVVTSARTSSYLSNVLLAQPEILKDWGLTETRAGKPLGQLSTEDLENNQILAADQLRTELIEDIYSSTRQEPKVLYYSKDVDTPQLKQALAEVDFNISDEPPTLRYDKTNAVWYGPEVALNDYKAVIVTLIRADIDIRRLGPSCLNLGNKIGVIEVGASQEAKDSPRKNIEDIRAAMSFDDLDDDFECET